MKLNKAKKPSETNKIKIMLLVTNTLTTPRLASIPKESTTNQATALNKNRNNKAITTTVTTFKLLSPFAIFKTHPEQ